MWLVLEWGWELGIFVGCFVVELNLKVWMLERLLVSKVDDFGKFLFKLDLIGEKVMFKGWVVDFGFYDLGFGYIDVLCEMFEIEFVFFSDDEGIREWLVWLVKKLKCY